MDKTKLVVVASILWEKFDDDDELLAFTTMQQRTSNGTLALSLQDREKHFRLGHLYSENLYWIDRYLDTDFHHRFRLVFFHIDLVQI